MRLDRRSAVAITVAASLSGASAAEAARFDIAPGPLGAVAAAIGARGRVTIAVTDPELAARRSPGARGDLSVRAALAAALHGTGAKAIFYDDVTVRIVRERTVRKRPQAPVPALPTPIDEPSPAIIVTASKQNVPLLNYPGSFQMFEPQAQWTGRHAARGSAGFTDLMPVLSSTNLGRGRNKLFVRGIADSSFNGQTQSTVGQYLGDARLNYNAPDPDLNLYDLKRIEVLAGPQGTLYGAGSLGGVVRLVPNTPDSRETYGTAAMGVSTTRHGGIGGDAAAMLNLPIGERTAIRGVVYGGRDAGYIDDPARGLRNINDGHSRGGRLALRREDLGGWTVDVGGVIQDIDSDDSQYTLRDAPPLTRSSALAQPFRNEYHLAYLSGRKRTGGGGEIVTATSFVRHKQQSTYDATGTDGTSSPRRFREQNLISFVAHETRLAGGNSRKPWVVGFAGLYNVSRISRSLGSPENPQRLVGVQNRQTEGSLFGQKSFPIGRSFVATAGGRFTIAHNLGQLLDDVAGAAEQKSETRMSLAGDAALTWRLSPRLSTYAHYQHGFRPGGFAVASGSATEGTEFAADDLSQIELGLRWRDDARDKFSFRAAIFFVDWERIQADIVDSAGLVNTANIGNGRIYGFDGEVKWRLLPGLALSASAFQNNSLLYEAATGFTVSGNATLPNIPRDGIRAAAEWQVDVGRRMVLSGNASLRYVGMSTLGPGPDLDIAQGRYFIGDAGARLDFGGFGLSLDITNIGDAHANTFAFGNPFGVTARDQITPLRPRTIRLGFDTRF